MTPANRSDGGDGRDREERIDRYVKDYSVRTLAEMLVELENLYAPHAARGLKRGIKKRTTILAPAAKERE